MNLIEPNMNEQQQMTFLIGAIIGGLIAGSLCGLLPLGIGRWKNRLTLGVSGLIACTLSGAALGILLAGPVAIIFALIIVVIGEPDSARANAFDPTHALDAPPVPPSLPDEPDPGNPYRSFPQ